MLTGRFDAMLYVNDLAKSFAFYVEGLGFASGGFWDERSRTHVPEPPEDADYVALAAGEQPLALHASREEVRGGAVMLHFEVADVDAYHRDLGRRGIEGGGPFDTPWGWRMFTVRDPDGHALGFYARHQPPS